jgi:hypothetical protein
MEHETPQKSDNQQYWMYLIDRHIAALRWRALAAE